MTQLQCWAKGQLSSHLRPFDAISALTYRGLWGVLTQSCHNKTCDTTFDLLTSSPTSLPQQLTIHTL